MRKPMSLADLKAILAARGFRIVLNADGSTSLRGKKDEATPALMRVVAHWRNELIADLKGTTGKIASNGSITINTKGQ